MALWIAAALGIFLLSTLAFDVVHYVLHLCSRSRFRALRRIGALHQTHHRFLPPDLQVRAELIPANLRHHVIPEYLTHLAVSAAWLWLAPLPAVLGAVALQTSLVAYILSQRGLDVNHRSRSCVRAYQPKYLCVPSYHALHHAYPDAHYAAYLKTFDHLMGTGASLAGLRVGLVGADTPFGSALRAELARNGVAGVAALDAGAEIAGERLAELDVLAVLHAGANPCLDSERAHHAIERFAEATRGRKLPPEVWATGSELEVAASRGDAVRLEAARAARDFAARARALYEDRRFIYRHLVLPEPRGPRGFGLLSPRAAARMALFFVRRGFRYVPVTVTGLAFANYLRFRYAIAPRREPQLAPRVA